jgi:hypothetical protein
MTLIRQFIVLLLLLTSAAIAAAAEGEYQVKAAMLYNFAKFVDWPLDSFGSEGRTTFCIAGKSPLSGIILQMQGKQAKGRTVAIRQIANPEEVTDCQILFIPHSENARIAAYLQQAARHSTLTVSDQERFATIGGMIGFYEDDSRVRFEINQENALKRHIQISSHLLGLARRVR